MDVRQSTNLSATSSKVPFTFEIKRGGDQILEVHVKRPLDNINKSFSSGHLPKIFRIQLPGTTKVDIQKYEQLLTKIFKECQGDLNQLTKMKFKGSKSGTKWNLTDVKESGINKIFRFLDRNNVLKLLVNSTPPKYIYNLKLEEVVGLNKPKKIEMPKTDLKLKQEDGKEEAQEDGKEEALFQDPFTKIATYANKYLESNFQSRDLDTHRQVKSDYIIVKKENSLTLIHNSDIDKSKNKDNAKEALDTFKAEMIERFGKEKLDYMSHLAFFDLNKIEYLTPEHVYRLNILACSVESQDVQSLIVKMQMANKKLSNVSPNLDLKEELKKLDFLSAKEVQSIIKYLKKEEDLKPTVGDLKASLEGFPNSALTDLYAVKSVILAKGKENNEIALKSFLEDEKLEISKDLLQHFDIENLKVKDFIPLLQTILLLKDEMRKTPNKKMSIKDFVEKFFENHPNINKNQLKIKKNVNIEDFLSMMDEPDSKLNESQFNNFVSAIGPTYEEKQNAYTGRKITKAIASRYTIAGDKFYKPWIEQQELLQTYEILEKDEVEDPYTGKTRKLTQKEKMQRFDEISAHIFSKKHLFRSHPTEGYRVGEIVPGPSGKNGEKRWYRVERMISSGEGILNYQLEPLGTDSELQSLCISRSTAPSLYSYQAGASVRNDFNPLSAPGYQGRKEIKEGMNPILKDHFIPEWVLYQHAAKEELKKGKEADLGKVKERLINAGKFLEEEVKRNNRPKSLHEVVREYNSEILLLSKIGAKKRDFFKKLLMIVPSKRNEFEKTVLHFANNFSTYDIENEDENKKAFRLKQELRGARVLLDYIEDISRKQNGKLDPRLQSLKNDIAAIKNSTFEPGLNISDIPEGDLKDCLDSIRELNIENPNKIELKNVEKKLNEYAISLGENVESKKTNGIRFTGHSLGGACAQIEASFMTAGSHRVPVPNTTLSVAAYDAPGINDEDNVQMHVHMAKHSEAMSDLKSSVNVYHSHEYGDIVPLGGSAHLGSRNASVKKALKDTKGVGKTFQVNAELQRATSYAVELETVDFPIKHETRFATTKQERTEELKQVEREIKSLSKKKAASDELMKVVKGGKYKNIVSVRHDKINDNLNTLKTQRLKYLGGRRVTKINAEELGSLTEKSKSVRKRVRKKWGMGIFDKERIKKIMTVSGLSIMPAFFKKDYMKEKREENLIEKGHGEAKKWWNPITHSLIVTRNGGPIDLSNLLIENTVRTLK